MGLFKRVSDIISANLNEMVERHEDPEKLLKQAIGEMEESIKNAEQDTARVLANEKKLKRELENNVAESERWNTEAENAIDLGDDDLARRALGRKRDYDTVIEALKDQVASAEPATATLRTQLDGMKAKLAEAKRNLSSLAARKQAAEIRKKALNTPRQDLTVSDSAFEKFERMREKVEQAEAEADALAELRGTTTSPSDSDSADDGIDAELAALKARRASKKGRRSTQ